MSADTLDRTKLAAYAQQAKAAWGNTAAYQEYETKARGRSESETTALAGEMMDLFRRFGLLRHKAPADAQAQALAAELQAFITEHYYTCTKEIFAALGRAYGAGGAFTANIDRAGGEGTAAFAAAAIAVYCRDQALCAHFHI